MQEPTIPVTLSRVYDVLDLKEKLIENQLRLEQRMQKLEFNQEKVAKKQDLILQLVKDQNEQLNIIKSLLLNEPKAGKHRMIAKNVFKIDAGETSPKKRKTVKIDVVGIRKRYIEKISPKLLSCLKEQWFPKAVHPTLLCVKLARFKDFWPCIVRLKLRNVPDATVLELPPDNADSKFFFAVVEFFNANESEKFGFIRMPSMQKEVRVVAFESYRPPKRMSQRLAGAFAKAQELCRRSSMDQAANAQSLATYISTARK